MEVLYKYGGKLVGERTRRPLKTTVTELQFADDAAIVGSSREEIERAARTLDEVASEWGLTLSLPKTGLLGHQEPLVHCVDQSSRTEASP